MNYNAFISYRRSNGFYMAQLIRDKLKEENLSAFLDMEELGSGKFDERIITTIENTSNFILILPEGALDRCVNEDDWLRREIITAVKSKKNIIPIIYDGFEWPKKWPVSMPKEIIDLEFQNCIIGSQNYFSAMMKKIISYMVGIDEQQTKNETINICSSSLTVIDALLQGWNCKEIFGNYSCNIEKHHYKWSDKILKDLDDEKIDLAIYNKKSALKYIKEHPDSDISLVRDVCSSMGGRNFYILASKNSKWSSMTFSQFRESIDNKTIFAVSKSSDMFSNLLYVLDLNEKALNDKEIKILDYHSEQGLQLFDVIPDLLVISGQDIRFLAEKSGGFFEIISYDSLPPEKKQFFFDNSVNSIIVNNKINQKLHGANIDEVAHELMTNFYKNSLDNDYMKSVKNKLSRQLESICDERDTIEYIINKILFETYRIM